mmetsp:Transcript_35430/g.61229  ORF Transcript_35430/g.61229 Transcript_35430/m.61229 type:complete len:150 (+) Transcript_35430:55-504(+)
MEAAPEARSGNERRERVAAYCEHDLGDTPPSPDQRRLPATLALDKAATTAAHGFLHVTSRCDQSISSESAATRRRRCDRPLGDDLDFGNESSGWSTPSPSSLSRSLAETEHIANPPPFFSDAPTGAASPDVPDVVLSSMLGRLNMRTGQ